MPVHTDCHNRNNCKHADYGSDAHGSIPAVYKKAEYDCNHNKQQRYHGNGRIGCGRRKVNGPGLV